MLTTTKITISAIVAVSAVSTAFTVAVTPATAATIAYVGDTTGQPQWRPPGVGADVAYTVQNFTVDTTGTYTFSSTVPTPAWARGLYLYANTFNPLTPLSNLIFGEGRLQSIFTRDQTLSSSSNYFLVTSGFIVSPGINSVGPYNNSITGPGNITGPGLNPTAVPEPFTILGSLIGGSAALRLRRKLIGNSHIDG